MKFFDNRGLIYESLIKATMVSIRNNMKTSVFSKIKLPKLNKNKKNNQAFDENDTFPISEIDSSNYHNESHKIDYDDGSNILVLKDTPGNVIDFTTPIVGDLIKPSSYMWNNIESSISSDTE